MLICSETPISLGKIFPKTVSNMAGDPDGAVASTRNILDCALAPEAARHMARAATRLSDKVLKDFISIPPSYDDPDFTVKC